MSELVCAPPVLNLDGQIDQKQQRRDSLRAAQRGRLGDQTAFNSLGS